MLLYVDLLTGLQVSLFFPRAGFCSEILPLSSERFVRLLKHRTTLNRTCALFLKWKIKSQQAEPTVALSASSVIQGQGLEVKGHLSIEPSAGGGERWACRRPIEAA